MTRVVSGDCNWVVECQRDRWPAADFAWAVAENLPPAATVQPVGSGGGASAVRCGDGVTLSGVDLGVEAAPDETTVCKLRRMPERNKLAKTLLKAVNEYPPEHGTKDCHRHHRGRDNHRRAERDQKARRQAPA